MTSIERYYQRLQRRRHDAEGRPGRAGAATVGAFFLSRPALTKSNPYFDGTIVYDEGVTTSTYAHYGVSTYGGDDVYTEEL